MKNRHENTTVNEGISDQEFTVGNSDGGQTVNENVLKLKTLETSFNRKIYREMGKIFDTIEVRFQNVTLTARVSIIIPKIEKDLAVRSINASPGRDATSVMASSDYKGTHRDTTAHLENVSEKNNTLHMLN